MGVNNFACLRTNNGPLWVNAEHIVWYEYDERFDVRRVCVGAEGKVFKLPGEQLGQLIGAMTGSSFAERIEDGVYKDAISSIKEGAGPDGR